MTENQQDCSSQSEVIRRFMGPLSSKVVSTYRNPRQLRWSATDRHLCINTPASGSGWWRTLQWSTSQHLADGWSHLKKEDYQVVRTQTHAFTPLQSLHLVTLMCLEPSDRL